MVYLPTSLVSLAQFSYLSSSFHYVIFSVLNKNYQSHSILKLMVKLNSKKVPYILIPGFLSIINKITR